MKTRILQSRQFRFAGLILIGALLAGLLYALVLDRSRGYMEMHMSCFVYRDVNRNGVYDMADRPYAGMKVAIDRPRGGRVETRSNIAGFANFKMSYGDNDKAIYRPGDYTIKVEPPRDWIVTSGNNTQTITLRHLAEAPVGMVANRTYEHVGIAPKLTIAGSVRIDVKNPPSTIARLEAISPAGETSNVPLSDTGSFLFDASAGSWQLKLTTRQGNSITREVQVADYPVRVSQIDSADVQPAKLPNLRTIGFDDLTASDTLYEIPSGYAGLNWNNWVATHHKFYRKHTHVNATVSSEYLAYTSAGHPAVIWSEKPVDFVGVFITMTLDKGESHDVIIKAWRDGELAYADRFRTSSSGPVWFAADYRGVTKIEFSNEGYWHAGIDDLEFRVASPR